MGIQSIYILYILLEGLINSLFWWVSQNVLADHSRCFLIASLWVSMYTYIISVGASSDDVEENAWQGM